MEMGAILLSFIIPRGSNWNSLHSHLGSDSVISGIGANTNYILLLFTQASYPYKNTAQYNAIPTDGFPMPTQFALNNEEDTLYIASNNFVYATHEYVWALYSLELSSKNYTTLWTGKSQLFIEYDHYKNNLLVFFWNGNAWNITVMTKPGISANNNSPLFPTITNYYSTGLIFVRSIQTGSNLERAQQAE